MCVEKVMSGQAVCSDGTYRGGRRSPFCRVRIALSETTAPADLAHALLLTRENSSNHGQGFGWIAHAPCPGQASSRDSHSSQGISLLDEEHRIKGYAAGRAQLFKTIGFFDASLGDVDGRSAPC